MKNTLLILSLTLAFLSHSVVASAPSSGENQSAESKMIAIIGGDIADIEDDLSYSTVFIQMRPFPTELGACTGALIEEDIVLTAAHCLAFVTAEQVEVIFTQQIEQQPFDPSLIRKAKKLISHPNFSFLSPLNDVALLQLESKAPSPYRPIALLKDTHAIKIGLEMNVYGFGIVDEDELTPTTHLRHASAPLFEMKESLLISDQKAGHGVCLGDSGGPVFLKKSQSGLEENYLYALTKGAYESERCDEFAAFTYLPAFQSFIESTIESFHSSRPPLFINSSEQTFIDLKNQINFGFRSEQKVKSAEMVMEEAKKIAKENNILFAIHTFQSSDGLAYPVMIIRPGNTSSQNNEATRIANRINNLKLIFSPFDLANGIDAYYDPEKSYIGVSYKFLTRLSSSDASYLHELFHVETLLNLRPSSLWAGSLESKKGTIISLSNSFAYDQFLSLDELLTTALSLKLASQKILQLKEHQSDKDFYASGYAEYELKEIYHLSKAGHYLAKQLDDVTTRALAQDLTTITSSSKNLLLGDQKKIVFETTLLLDSYKHQYGGQERVPPFKEGTAFKLYWGQSPDPQKIKNRLTEIKKKAQSSIKSFKNVLDAIYVLIDYPKLEKTNVHSLSKLGQLPFDELK